MDIQHLFSETFVARVEHHATIGSTNDRAKQCAEDPPGDLPLLVVADSQTAGRGRGANRWWTGPGSSALSLLLEPEQVGAGPEGRAPLVALAAGVAVVRTVRPLLLSHPVGLHWPNDVMADGRKLAGILVEVVPNGRYIVGIGLNTNNTLADAPAELQPVATTIRDLTGQEHDRTEILVELLKHLEAAFLQLADAPEQLAAEADSMCLQHGKRLTIRHGHHRISGRCLGIAPDGALLLDTPVGRRPFYSGVLLPPTDTD